VAFIAPEDLLPAAAAVVAIHRDHGDRSDRRHARLKYLIAEKGEEWARAELETRLGKRIAPPAAMPGLVVPDHLGWHEQGDGKLYLGIHVPSGRIRDNDGSALRRSALRAVIERFSLPVVLLPTQHMILSHIDPADRPAIESLLAAHRVPLAETLPPVERWAMACPALPTCGLALTEAERVREVLISGISGALAQYGLQEEKMSIRITGCPNGCARPYAGDIGIVGRMPDHFALFVGGDFEGTRLNFLLLDRVPQAEVANRLSPLFALFAAERLEGEGFGDFCHRVGATRLREAGGSESRGARDAESREARDAELREAS
ncbi:MAG TPA: NADPH-dependent assimilatory sulfite reductase hemoprotein subunit, partial [Stellaceae bacterium]|nr:NADPH-dependent assimilatory sulfite reductase hemoprotein subunit [Stellaceae bacterium]